MTQGRDLAFDVQCILRFWREYISSLLNDSENEPAAETKPDYLIEQLKCDWRKQFSKYGPPKA